MQRLVAHYRRWKLGQITEQFAADMLDRAERGLRPQFTVWEAKQLLLAWQEREKLRKDAERYRWLRDNPWPPVLEADILLHRNARWDAEIDAAMAASVAVGAA